jgi:hypothetical protein
MYEQSKINEARHFYNRMLSETDSKESVLYDLSAFLSAARSVLQYCLKEAKGKSGGQQWYDDQVRGSKVLSFFKDKRDVNVHVEPIQINQNTSIELTDFIRVSESVHIQKFDETGKLIGESSSEPSQEVPVPDIPPRTSHRFTFPDWGGREDVLQLCDCYLKELHRVVTDGQDRGFLTK